ncbi:hypothetical protein [Actinokineospora pegani]|uniref:hypothetical protein n=1 Tax=Actinokineospora pegani TaxID=2654637 RepID=UPI0012EAF561|nr:hypothetical protein [Actinokineospora pegani]
MNSSPNERSVAPTAPDRVRQGVVAVLAVAQIGSSYTLGQSAGTVARENPSSILPAGYAFAIWGLIFAASLAYAVAALTPSLAAHPVVRATGWPVAVAFAANTVWALVFPERLFVLSQVVIVIGMAAAVWTTIAAQRAADGNRLVATLFCGSFGLLAGWLTAATFVGLANTVSALGGGAGQVTGLVLLVLAAAVAAYVLHAGSGGPLPGSLAYGFAVVWGLVAITVEQWTPSRTTAVAALVLGVLLAGVLAATRRRSRNR